MHTRRLVKRSILGSRVYAPSPTEDGAPLTGVVQAVKPENRDVSSGPRRNVYTVLMQDGSLKEFSEEEIAVGFNQTTAKAPLKSSLKQTCSNGAPQPPDGQRGEMGSLSPEAVEEQRVENVKRLGRVMELPDREHPRSVSLLEQKRKVVSCSIDVPHARKSEEEVDMDKVTAAMVLTSLSTSPLVRSPPVKVSEGLNGSWKEGGGGGSFTASSYSSSGGYWSWSAPSDQSNPSTPSPPLSADSFKPFRMPSAAGPPPDDALLLDDQDGSSLLFDEPIPRKRKNSMKVMFKCLWKNCGKVLSTAAGIQRHIRTVHLGRNCDSDCSDGEEDFYYSEIKLNTDSVAEGLSSLSPVSPSVPPPPATPALPGPPGPPQQQRKRGAAPQQRHAPQSLRPQRSVPHPHRPRLPGHAPRHHPVRHLGLGWLRLQQFHAEQQQQLQRLLAVASCYLHWQHCLSHSQSGAGLRRPAFSDHRRAVVSSQSCRLPQPEVAWRREEVPQGVRHGEPRHVVHRLPLEESLPEIHRLNPAANAQTRVTNTPNPNPAEARSIFLRMRPLQRLFPSERHLLPSTGPGPPPLGPHQSCPLSLFDSAQPPFWMEQWGRGFLRIPFSDSESCREPFPGCPNLPEDIPCADTQHNNRQQARTVCFSMCGFVL